MIVRQGTALAICGALAGALLAAQSAKAAEYLVKFKDAREMTRASLTESIEGATVVDTHAPGALLAVELGTFESKASEAEALAKLMGRDDVEYVVENFKLNMLGLPNDPKLSEQWAISKVNAGASWDYGVGSRAVKIAVIDTGVDASHPDLAANIWTNPAETANGRDDDGNGLVDDLHGWDYLDNDKDPNDITSDQNPGHGTHCAGILGAVGNNSAGITGMSQQVSIIPLRFIGPTGQGDLMAAIKAIDYAIAVRADVISASWGAKVSASQAQPLIEAVGRADAAGLVFVAAAANDGANNDVTSMYPANSDFPNVISVAASDNQDAKPQWSNFGKATVDLASPGLTIMSTLPANTFGNLSGTSMATPLVAGMVGLLKSQARALGRPELSGLAVQSLLQTTGARVAIETACMCRVDAGAASAALSQNRLVVVPAAATFSVSETGRFAALGGSGGYRFQSADSAILEVAADGALTAKAVGETTVKVTDSNGATADSLTLRVAEDGGGGGGGEECPLGDPMMCQLMCLIDPTLPWCQ